MSDTLHETLIEDLLARPVSERDHAAANEINTLRELLTSKGYYWRTGEPIIETSFSIEIPAKAPTDAAGFPPVVDGNAPGDVD